MFRNTTKCVIIVVNLYLHIIQSAPVEYCFTNVTSSRMRHFSKPRSVHTSLWGKRVVVSACVCICLPVCLSRSLCPQHLPASRSGVTRKVRPSILGYTIWNLLTVSLLSLTTLLCILGFPCMPPRVVIWSCSHSPVPFVCLGQFIFVYFCVTLFPYLPLCLLVSQVPSPLTRELVLAARVLILGLSSVVSCSPILCIMFLGQLVFCYSLPTLPLAACQVSQGSAPTGEHNAARVSLRRRFHLV